MKWPSNNRSIDFLFKYKMNYINYYIIKMAVKLKKLYYINIVKTYIFILLLL